MHPKRKLPSLGLERRVRARREDGWMPESESEEKPPSDAVSGEAESDETESDETESEPGSEPGASHTGDAPPRVDLSSVSFGALARAQASLPPAGHASRNTRLDGTTEEDNPRRTVRTTKKPDPEPKPKRSSKHAPQEQSSKKPVSRRREILVDPRRKYRDPRFDRWAGPLDESKANKAYAFLDEYRDREMADLRAQITTTKDPTSKQDLKRQLMSMESRKKARQSKQEEEALLQEHRKQEKELVAMGKKPFYLKKGAQKKQLLTKRYESMSKQQVDKAIERKRKKVAGKEKKELGSLRRIANRPDKPS